MVLDKWTATKPFSMGSYHAVAYGNGEFVAVGPSWIVSSKDEGASWSDHTIRTGPDPAQFTKVYYGVAYGDGVFVAVGAARIRWDGSSVSLQISQTVAGVTKFLRAITHGTVPLGGHGAPKSYGLFVAVGDAGTILTTRDGLTWAASTTGIAMTDEFKAVAFGNQRFVAATSGGRVLTSPDGITWTAAPTPASALRRLTFDGNRFVGIDGVKKVVTSLDGTSWTNLSTALTSVVAPMESIASGYNTFAVVGPNGALHTSSDGVAWAAQLSGSTQHLGGIAYGTNRVVAVGATGDIVRSSEFPTADLFSLTTSAGPLTPVFSSPVTAYTVSVGSGTATATVTPTSEDPQATIRVRFNSGSDVVVASGTPSALGRMRGFGTHTFDITVIARNNATKVYTVGVNRKAPTLMEVFGWFWPFR